MRDTLHISARHWIVERPHATGSYWGPGRYTLGGAPLSAEEVKELEEVHLPYYRKAGFLIVDKRPKGAK